MPTWMTAKQISARFAVGEERIIAYGQRGNLAMYRMDDGAVLFDGDGAARYFRLRTATTNRTQDAENLGVLGSSRLGDAYEDTRSPRSSLGGREERRRDVRSTVTNAAPERRAKAG